MSSASRPLDIGVYGARAVPSTYSGYETFLTTLLPELVRGGDKVTMYCRPGEGADDETPWNGVGRKVVSAIAGKNFNTLSHGLTAGIAARRAKHDVLLVVNVANAPFCLIGHRTGQPVVLNVDGQEWLRAKWGRVAKGVFKGSARISRRCATALIADSPAMAEVYESQFGAASTIIPYCITGIEWAPDPATPKAHDLAPFNYLMIAGRFNPENNIHHVAQQLADSDLDVTLVVLGTANYDSPVTTAIRELAERDPRIRPLGHVGDRSAYFDLVHHAGVYLHGHSVGGTNPSLVEAMAAGARICAIDNAFSRETLRDSARYFTLEPPTLVATLREMLGDSSSVDAEARAQAKARAEDAYSIQAVADAYRELLVAAVQAGAGRGGVRIDTRWAAE